MKLADPQFHKPIQIDAIIVIYNYILPRKNIGSQLFGRTKKNQTWLDSAQHKSKATGQL